METLHTAPVGSVGPELSVTLNPPISVNVADKDDTVTDPSVHVLGFNAGDTTYEDVQVSG
jgi:hypothetical protein